MSRTKGSLNNELRTLRQGKNLVKGYFNRVGWDKLEKEDSKKWCSHSRIWHENQVRIKVLVEILKTKK